MWKKRFRKNNTYDLVVSGNTLAAYVAIVSATANQLKVCWLCPPAPPSTFQHLRPSGFDSLAPEGVHYLCHIVSNEELKTISLGCFEGIYRNSGFQAFSPHLGKGIHFNTSQLKDLLLKKFNTLIKKKVIDTVSSVHFHSNQIHINTSKHPTLTTKWIIDAQGKNSDISTQHIELLSSPIWISRSDVEIHPHASKNQVKFELTEDGWRWKAYDQAGGLCITQWQGSKPTNTPTDKMFNSEWYRRPSCIEYVNDLAQRVLLTVPTCYRFDPSSGLGATLQIKSALHAVRCVLLSRSSTHAPQKEIELHHIHQYERQMESSFQDIYTGLHNFYKPLGVSFF